MPNEITRENFIDSINVSLVIPSVIFKADFSGNRSLLIIILDAKQTG